MQPAIQGGFPSPGPKPSFEIMKSAHSAAITSNERIFPIFATKLASRDTKEFTNTTNKLAVWLGSEKAYYPTARPKIVELLEIALLAFMDTFVHHSSAVELAEHLRKLVNAVIPFEHLFLENDLQLRLQRIIFEARQLFSRLSTSTANGNTLPQVPNAASVPLPTQASPVHPQLTVPPISGPQRSMSWIQSSSSVLNVAKPISNGSVHGPSEMLPSSQINAIPSPASAVANTPQDLGEIISAAIPSKPQPKRARRAELSEELIARDLDWFKSNLGVAVVNENSDLSSTANETSSGSDPPRISGRSPSPKKRTARMVPSRRLPRRIPLNVAQGESDISASILPPSEPSHGQVESFENIEDVSIRMDVDEQHLSLERIESDVRSPVTQEVPDIPEASRLNEELPGSEPQPVTTSLNVSSRQLDLPQTDHQPSPVDAASLNGEPRLSPRPSPPHLKARLHETQPMNISTSDIGLESLPSDSPSMLEQALPQSPQMLQFRGPNLPLLVNALDPPLDLNFKISAGRHQQSGTDTNQHRFGDEMTVVHCTQGKPFTHIHKIDIDMNESIWSKVAKWVNREHHPSEASQGVCISLACYRLPDFFDRVRSGKHDIEELTSRSPCSWPCSNRLSLCVNDEERRSVITPLFLTPDQCIDVSSRMKLGNNTVEIIQQDDLSEYLIVFHAHRPTRAQLTEFATVKSADERWIRLLDAICVRPTQEGTEMPGMTTANDIVLP